MALTQISTAGVKDDAVTSGKIPADAIGSSEIAANAVGSSELADNAVDTAAIADQAVTLDKLPHGTSSNDGKFLRANNGADPSFETVTSTTINNNASGRFVVGSNTANTLDAKSEATYNGTKLLLTGGVGQDQHIPMLELKHLNTAYSSGNGDGPAILLNGYYSSNEWALAKIAAVNAGGQYGSGYAGGLQFWVHPANGTQTASVIKGAEIIGDGTGADLYITDGDIKVASGHGIDFSATGNGGTGTPNELFDDYEEGSWTPAIEGLSNTPGFHNLGGNYTKIGNRVFLQCHIQIDGNNKPLFSNQSSTFKISGLPFTGDNSGAGGGYFGAHGVCVWQQLQWVGASYSSYGASNDTQLSPGIVDSGTRISLQTCGQDIYYTGQLLNRALHNNYAPNIEFDMCYKTAS